MSLREVKKPETVGISSRGAGQVTFVGLTAEEIDWLQAMRNGAKWVRVVDGRLRTHDAHKGFPDPIADREMQPFWRSSSEVDGVQLDLFYTHDSFEPKTYQESCSIHISGLCGYHYSKENYERQAELLLSYGFVQMRSRRGECGRYWEVWYLPSLWAAKGALKDEIEKRPKAHSKIQSRIAIEFLRKNVQFGSMDISYQRLAMVLD